MVKDEEVAPYLSEAFSRYASGQKMRDIAKWLNEQNVEPPMKHKKRIQGKPYEGEPDLWTSDNLRGLFRNPTYTGATANGSHQIIAENCHEPYMTKEQFYAKEADQFLQSKFQGSLKSFLAAFSSEKKLSDDEMQDLKDWFDGINRK